MLCQRVPSGSPARDEKGLGRKLVTSDNFAKVRQISVSPRSWFIDTVGFPRGPPKSHLFLGESEKKRSLSVHDMWPPNGDSRTSADKISILANEIRCPEIHRTCA